MNTFFSPQFYRTLVRRFLAFLGICVLFFIVAQTTILPGVLERTLQRIMEQAGIPVQSLEIRSVSWSHAVFSPVTLGHHGETEIDTLQMEYTLHDLLRGRLQALRISGALITLPWQRNLAHRAESTLTARHLFAALPFERLILSSSSLLFTRNDVRFRIPFEATVQRQPQHLALNLKAELLGGQTTLSITAAPDGTPQRLAASLRGVNFGLLPHSFLPAFFTAPLQGALNGTLQATRRNDTWKAGADLNFHIAGAFRHIPFSLQPARMEYNLSLTPQGLPQHIQADFACENIHFNHWMLQNFSAEAQGNADELNLRFSGADDTWNFGDASARITGWLPPLQPFITHRHDASGPAHIQLHLNKFNGRMPTASFYADTVLCEADLIMHASAPQLINTRLTLQNGQLTGRNMLVHGIQTTLQIDEFFPFTTRDTQQIRIDHAEFGGLLLTNGLLTCQMNEPHHLFIDRCEWNWCGGRLSARAFSFPFDAPEIKCSAFFENISLNELCLLLLRGTVQGTGHLFGRMPVNLRLTPEPALSFGRGYLYAVPSFGTLRLHDESMIEETLVGSAPSTPPTHNIPRDQLVREALLEYHFQLLKFHFARVRENGLSGHLQLRGNGPPPNELPLGLTLPFAIE